MVYDTDKEVQNMLGVVGFVVGAISVGAFAFTARRAYASAVDIRKLEAFSLGFLFLAIAMLFWALVVAANDPAFTKRILLTSDVLLLAGTICMGRVLVTRVTMPVAAAIVTLAGLAIANRSYVYPPTGYVHDGLLYFNLQGGVRVVVLALFILVWLPAVLIIARNLVADPVLAFLKNGLVLSFVSLIAASAILLAARRSGVVIFSFISIVGLFLAMAYVNLQMEHAHALNVVTKPTRRKHRATRTAKA